MCCLQANPSSANPSPQLTVASCCSRYTCACAGSGEAQTPSAERLGAKKPGLSKMQDAWGQEIFLGILARNCPDSGSKCLSMTLILHILLMISLFCVVFFSEEGLPFLEWATAFISDAITLLSTQSLLQLLKTTPAGSKPKLLGMALGHSFCLCFTRCPRVLTQKTVRGCNKMAFGMILGDQTHQLCTSVAPGIALTCQAECRAQASTVCTASLGLRIRGQLHPSEGLSGSCPVI